MSLFTANTGPDEFRPDPSKAIIPLTPIPEGVEHPILGRLDFKRKIAPGSGVGRPESFFVFHEELTPDQARAILEEWKEAGPDETKIEKICNRYYLKLGMLNVIGMWGMLQCESK